MRKLQICLTSFLALSLIAFTSAFAETDLYVSGAGRLIPIALPKLCPGPGKVGGLDEKVPSTLKKDLEISGLFNVVDENAYLESGKCGEGIEKINDSDWSVIGADGVVKGEASISGGTLTLKLMLHDVARKMVAFGKEYTGEPEDARMMAHKFANEIVKYYTGETGFFGSKIVYTSRIGRFKELYMVDADGENVTQLTNDKSLNLSPSFSPNGRKVVFTSYRKRTPDLFELNLANRSITQFSKSSSLEVGPRFSRNGFGILVSITSDRDTDLFLLSEDGDVEKKLTPTNSAIDVSADWSPDGKEIVFCSNRGGNPQIYKMNISSGETRRISYTTSNYCTSPSWSPKGHRISFVCRFDGGFQIYTSDPDGENAKQLTSYGNNEDPDWSPDGRWLVFSSNFGGGPFNLAIMKGDGTGVRQLTRSRSGDSEPSWGPLP